MKKISNFKVLKCTENDFIQSYGQNSMVPRYYIIRKSFHNIRGYRPQFKDISGHVRHCRHHARPYS